MLKGQKVRKGGGGDAPHTGAEIPLQASSEAGFAPVAYGGPHWNRYLLCSFQRRWKCPAGSCSLWKACTGADSWQEL